MASDSNIKVFVRSLEKYAGRTLAYSTHIEEILTMVEQADQIQTFNDLIFQSKFSTKTQEVMKRIGPGADGFEKLASEFQSSIHQSTDLLRQLIVSSEKKEKFEEEFLKSDTNSFKKLLLLLSELQWIKNWQVDGKPLPYEKDFAGFKMIYESEIAKSKNSTIDHNRRTDEIRLRRGVIFCSILFILFLLIDTPATTLGWIISLGILALLVYILIEIMSLTRHTKPYHGHEE